jgi:amino acid transporter
MVTYLPISSPFIRFAGRFVDDSLGVAAGWNFFAFEAALVPFEIVACNVIIRFWTDAIPTGAVIAIVIVLYAYVNISHPYSRSLSGTFREAYTYVF